MPPERFILIPGMGADARLFLPQRADGLDFEVPDFPVPAPDDDMQSYAARIRDALQLDGPCVLGGVSFGGMVACELARLCSPRCVLLIASCRSGAAIARYYRLVELFGRLLPDAVVRKRAVASSRMLAKLESLTQEQYQLIRAMSIDVPVPFIRRVGHMILNWKADPELPVSVHHIHGGKDRIISLRRVDPDEVIPDGGHLINLTHAHEVNAFIRRHLQQPVAPSRAAP